MRREYESRLLPATVEWYSVGEAMEIDYDGMLALQIIKDNNHPNAHYNVKTGLSLLGLMNQCKSQAGKAQMKKWILNPSRNIQIIRDRHRKVGELINHICLPGKAPAFHKVLKGSPLVIVKATGHLFFLYLPLIGLWDV